MTYSSSPSRRPFHRRAYRSRTRPALGPKPGSRGKIHDRHCHGLITSSSRIRRTVEADSDPTTSRSTASWAISAQVHAEIGRPRSAGNEHAIAFTSAATTGENTRGRPLRGRSAKPLSRPAANRPPTLADRVERDAQAGRDRRVRLLRRGGQHDPGPQHITLLGPGPDDPSLQDLSLTAGQPDRHRSRRASRPATARRWIGGTGCGGTSGSSHASVVPAATVSPMQAPRHRDGSWCSAKSGRQDECHGEGSRLDQVLP